MSNLLLFLTVASPLLVTPQTYELFEFPKMIFVYVVSALLLARLLWPKKEAGKPFNFKSLWPVWLYAGSFLLSFLFSQNHTASFYGYYTRFNGGLLSLLSYLIIFVSVIRITRTDRNFLKKAVKTILWASVPVSLYAVAQHFGIDDQYWVQNVKLRVFSTLGQPNWLASYLLLVMPLAAYQLITRSHKTLVTYAIVSLFALQFSAFWFTYSLSGLLGFAAGAIAFLILNKKLARRAPRKLALLASICLGMAVLFPGPLASRIKELKNIAQENRTVFAAETIESTENAAAPAGGDTGRIRLLVWKGALKLWVSSPKTFLIGAGPETFAFSFLKYRPEALNYTSEWDFLYNKAHNEYLNILATTGLLGCLTYLGVIYFTFKKKAQTPLGKSLLAGIIGMLVSIFFGFSTVITSLYLWIYLGLSYAKENS